MSLSQSDDELFPTDMFEEPAGFRPPSPTETVHKFTMKNGVELSVSLIGNHSLWAHCLWNAGVFLAKHFDESPYIVKGKRILEFGAAAALPSLLSAKHGAELVVITDYPDQVLVNMLNENAKSNLNFDEIERVACLGFLWGDCTAELMEKSPSGYEIIIMSDLIFNHTFHMHLLRSAKKCLANTKEAKILVPFSHHRPHLADKDMNFFKLAEEMGFECVKHEDSKMTAMFEKDPGSLEVRETIHFYSLTRMCLEE